MKEQEQWEMNLSLPLHFSWIWAVWPGWYFYFLNPNWLAAANLQMFQPTPAYHWTTWMLPWSIQLKTCVIWRLLASIRVDPSLAIFCKCIIGIINATGQHQHAELWDCAPGHCAELEVETEMNESKREGETWPCSCVTLMLATVQHWPCQFARDSSLTGTQSLINTIQCVYLGHCGVDWKKTINVLFLLGDGLAEKEAERQMFDWEF